MSMPISMLENLLQDKPTINNDYFVEVANEEFVTIGELINFWNDNHNEKEKNNVEIQKQPTKKRTKAAGKKVS